MKLSNLFLFAQATDFPQVPNDTFKWTVIVVLGLACIVMGAILFARQFKEPPKTRLEDEPEGIKVRKAPKRYNHDQIDLRFMTVENRVAAVEAEQDSTWDEIQTLKDKQAERHLENSNRLVRIMERLGIKEDLKS